MSAPQAPRERPILFSGPMVRAILDDRKTQTRRPMKPQPPEDDTPLAVEWFTPSVIRANSEMEPADKDVFGAYAEEWSRVSPMGAPGDRLWVRETWVPIVGEDFADGSANVGYQAGGIHALSGRDRHGRPREMPPATRWRPSIHMPRWASRLTLEITGVRVERVAGISAEDVRAEGTPGMVAGRYQCRPCNGNGSNHTWPRPKGCPSCTGTGNAPAEHFRELWVAIYGADSWARNDWCWVYDFRRLA